MKVNKDLQSQRRHVQRPKFGLYSSKKLQPQDFNTDQANIKRIWGGFAALWSLFGLKYLF